MKWKLTGLFIFFSNFLIASSTPHDLPGYNFKYKSLQNKWQLPVTFAANNQPIPELTTLHEQSCTCKKNILLQTIPANNIHVQTMIFADGTPAANQSENRTELKKLKDFWKTNELLIGLSFVILVGLIIFFVWRKKKSKNIDMLL